MGKVKNNILISLDNMQEKAGCPANNATRFPNISICSIERLSFGSKDYNKELKTVECTSFLGQTTLIQDVQSIC